MEDWKEPESGPQESGLEVYLLTIPGRAGNLIVRKLVSA